MNSPKPASGATSCLILSNSTTPKRSRSTLASALVALGVGIFFLYFFISFGGLPPQPTSLNGVATLLPLAITPCALIAALGLMLGRAWGKTFLLITTLLLLALMSTGALYALTLLTAPSTRADTVRLTNALLVMLIALLPALSLTLVGLTVRPSGSRFARIALPIAFFLLALLVWLFTRLVH